MKHTWKGLTVRFAGLALAIALVTHPAHSAALGYSGTGGWATAGVIGVTGGVCNPVCDSGFVPFDTGVLLDGMEISGQVRQIIQEAGGNTLSALLLVTNIVATNFNVVNTASDTLFIVSDQFDPSVPGPVGVGIIGAFVANLGGNIPLSSVQGQMNFLTTGLITQAAFGGPLTGFTLNTTQPFVACLLCGPVPFATSNFGVDAAGGVEQLVGAINFTLGPGASIVMPGSFLIEENDNEAITSEVPEPATAGICGGSLVALGLIFRRFARK
jgi:hypothetical protein